MKAAHFGNLPYINPSAYAQPANGNGNNFLRLYQAKNNYMFAHRENAKAAVHALTIVENAQKEQFVHLLIVKRPPLGGKPTIETPAGLWGDKDQAETALQAANREVREETGYRVEQSKLLSPGLFATSPGMTTEHKAFALTMTKGEPQAPAFQDDEFETIAGSMDVPLSTFANHDKFLDWINQKEQEGYTVAIDVIAARGLMPDTVGGRLNLPG